VRYAPSLPPFASSRLPAEGCVHQCLVQYWKQYCHQCNTLLPPCLTLTLFLPSPCFPLADPGGVPRGAVRVDPERGTVLEAPHSPCRRCTPPRSPPTSTRPPSPWRNPRRHWVQLTPALGTVAPAPDTVTSYQALSTGEIVGRTDVGTGYTGIATGNSDVGSGYSDAVPGTRYSDTLRHRTQWHTPRHWIQSQHAQAGRAHVTSQALEIAVPGAPVRGGAAEGEVPRGEVWPSGAWSHRRRSGRAPWVYRGSASDSQQGPSAAGEILYYNEDNSIIQYCCVCLLLWIRGVPPLPCKAVQYSLHCCICRCFQSLLLLLCCCVPMPSECTSAFFFFFLQALSV